MRLWPLLLVFLTVSQASIANEPTGSDRTLYLHEIEVVGGADPWPDVGPLWLSVETDDSDRLITALDKTSIESTVVDDGTVAVALVGDDRLVAEKTEQMVAASWVVDFDEPAVERLVNQLWAEQPEDEALTAEAITRFTFRTIETKNSINGFSLASQVASSLEGDCTEHAVLNAALARASGFPSRVVLGVLVVRANQRTYAFGHAWNEIYDDNGWAIHDATRPAEETGIELAYLPLSEMTDEGPSYVLSLAEFAFLRPGKIRSGAPAPAESLSDVNSASEARLR